jgi:nucleoside-diphosphate-sugar epimerase
MKRALVFGAAGFIGSHLAARLKEEGYWVAGADVRKPEHGSSLCDHFSQIDLRDASVVARVIGLGFDELYQLAADMGGTGYICSGEHDADVMNNSALINLHTARIAQQQGVGKVFFSSSACVYPRYNQQQPSRPQCCEDSTYPAEPDSEYGWEKLFSERMFLAFRRNHGLDVRIARFHNVYGPGNAWRGGREKAPAAICRKVAEAPARGEIEIWGDGLQTRSFLYVDDCIEGVRALMESSFAGPVNIGSEEMVTINQLALLVSRIAGKHLTIRHVAGPTGVRGRNSDNRLVFRTTGWSPKTPLEKGLRLTYHWVEMQVRAEGEAARSAAVAAAGAG